MNPLGAAAEWLATVLADDDLMEMVSAVYQGFGPEDAAYPFVTFHLQSSSDSLTNGGDVAVSEPQYTVWVCGEGWSPLALSAAASKVDEIILGAAVPVTVGSARILGAVRMRPLADENFVNQIRYNRLGGLYKLFIEAV